ncbi:MAG: AMP-binding protein [Actinomyces graevenitzii]|uniref:AMP-binding protein n=1 Tax=Actinomyces graevenitzii TaxID=55565 RepID=A0A9E7AG04_9ACTO|nr:AMP-binding protein [Actinomyces graevenitzii]UQF79970.1 MAG: AMP-binding protein [Actinomyces graevenitzii]
MSLFRIQRTQSAAQIEEFAQLLARRMSADASDVVGRGGHLRKPQTSAPGLVSRSSLRSADVAHAQARSLAKQYLRPSREIIVPIAPHEDTREVAANLARRIPARASGRSVGVDMVLRTSGSTTGTGKLVGVSMDALVASARATHKRLGGPGIWVLALPAYHAAGVQVLVRAAVAGTHVFNAYKEGGFDPQHLAQVIDAACVAAADCGAGSSFDDDAVSSCAGGVGGEAEGALAADDSGRACPVYTSLVPTQLRRALDDEQLRGALARLDAVLIGGAAADAQLLEQAKAAGIRVVTTYGMSETCGGCVYDGQPLPGVSMDVDQATGAIWLSGPMLATGYLGDEERTRRCFVSRPQAGEPARRWFITSDRGHIVDGRLQVLGRLDDVIISGGIKVEPGPIEALLALNPLVSECAVVGLPDLQWGQVVTAVVVPASMPGLGRVDEGAILAQIRVYLEQKLSGAQCPKQVLLADALPYKGIGKVDRRALAQSLARA